MFLSLIGIIAAALIVGFLVGWKIGRTRGYTEAVDEWFEDDNLYLGEDALAETGDDGDRILNARIVR